MRMKTLCLLWATFTARIPGTLVGDICLQFCAALSSDCSLPTFCGPTGDCMDLFWSDAERQSLDMTYDTSLEDTEWLQVTCQEAEEGLLALQAGGTLPRKAARHSSESPSLAHDSVMRSIHLLQSETPFYHLSSDLGESEYPELGEVPSAPVASIPAVMMTTISTTTEPTTTTTTLHPAGPPSTAVLLMRLHAAAAAFNGAMFPALVDVCDSFPFLTGKWATALTAARVKGRWFLKLLSQTPMDALTRVLTLDVLRKDEWYRAIDVLTATTINMRFLPSPGLERFATEVIAQFRSIMEILDGTNHLPNLPVILSSNSLAMAREARSDILFRLGLEDDPILPQTAAKRTHRASTAEAELTSLLATLAVHPNITNEDDILDFLSQAVLDLTQAELAWIGSRVCEQFDAVAMPVLMRSHTTNSPISGEARGNIAQFLARACGPRRVSHRTRVQYIPNLLVFSFAPSPREPVRFPLRHPLRSMALMEETLRRIGSMYKNAFVHPMIPDMPHVRAQGDGVRVEWIKSVLESAADPTAGFFTDTDGEGGFLIPTNGGRRPVDDFNALGRVIGLALKHGITPGLHLAKSCLYWLMRSPVDSDEEEVSTDVLTEWFREMDGMHLRNLLKIKTDPEVMDAMLGTKFPGKDRRTLSRGNVDDFIEASIWHNTVVSVGPAMRAIQQGIYDVIPYGQLEWLMIDELNELIGGRRGFAATELRDSSTFVHATGETAAESDPVNYQLVQIPPRELTWFWEIVLAMDQEQLGLLLEFFSGSKYPPVGGFAGFDGTRRWLQVRLEPRLALDAYPRAQLCFKQIYLPPYSSLEVMRNRILTAISYANTMDIA